MKKGAGEANTETISELVRKRRWTLIGHVLRMGNSSLTWVFAFGIQRSIRLNIVQPFLPVATNVSDRLRFWKSGSVSFQFRWFRIRFWVNFRAVFRFIIDPNTPSLTGFSSLRIELHFGHQPIVTLYSGNDSIT